MNIDNAQHFVDLIDTKFQESVGKINRIDVQWGTWSRVMNIALNKKIKEGGPDAFIFGEVFTYWILISQLLDLLYNCKGLRRILKEKKIKTKTAEALVIRKRILDGSN